MAIEIERSGADGARPRGVFKRGSSRNEFDIADTRYPSGVRKVLRSQIEWVLISAWDQTDSTLFFSFDAGDLAPATEDDVVILREARAILVRADWDRADDRNCENDLPSRVSLYCALARATKEQMGRYHHRQPALRFVRELVAARWPERIRGHRLMDFNNHEATSVQDVVDVLIAALERARMEVANPARLCAGCAVASTRQQTIEAIPEPIVDRISFETRAGTSLAFDIARDGRSIVLDLLGQLWLLPGEGGAAVPITDAVRDTAEDLDPVFSPDGQWVVFQGDRAGVKGLWLVRRDGTGLTRLTDQAASAAITPAWAPDGRSLAFALRDSIRIMDVGSRVVRTLRIEGLPSPAARYPAWSADGAYIAFAHPGGRIWEVASEGGTASALTPASLNARAPAYSPDNSRIAFFARDSAGIMQVWVQERTGGAPQRLTNHLDTTPLRVRWSQGGDAILYAADGLLWRRRLSGGQPEPIPFTARVSFSRA
ncbi:MAG TPA: hypothetical protein VMM77_01215, partial [Gemmatimonadaceae bacterium]|nr:hypothetical protein [Gemmatimonadaceae bacterium]